MSRGISQLACACEDGAVYIVGTGPTASEFPLLELERREKCSIALNRAVRLFNPEYWLFGDPHFSKRRAPGILADLPSGFDIVMNQIHIEHFESQVAKRRIELPTIFSFTNVVRGEREGWKGEWYRAPLHDNFLPGRWNIATIALSLATLMGAARIVLIGVDMGRVDGKYSTGELDDEGSRRRDDCMNQGAALMGRMRTEDQWPADIVIQTTSPYLVNNVPKLGARLVSVDEALS